ncbi:MAG: Na+/H+ antiporter subunit E [Gammaproteobacteria bacterium]|nr:Na+/H+ antiporter subunit E [Gammaproteobacteria bacterium]
MTDRSKSLVVVFAAALLLWLLLTASLAWQELLVGVVVALTVALATRDPGGFFAALRFEPRAPLHAVRFLGTFLVALVRANVDMARRVLTPALPIRPAVVKVRTGLASELGRLLLANSITLTPGTLAVDLEGDELLVHWVDCPPGTDMEGATRHIAAGFERHLAGFVR